MILHLTKLTRLEPVYLRSMINLSIQHFSFQTAPQILNTPTLPPTVDTAWNYSGSTGGVWDGGDTGRGSAARGEQGVGLGALGGPEDRGDSAGSSVRLLTARLPA